MIAGGSDAAGHEIDGNQDSKYNRSKCFGARLTDKNRVFSGYKFENIAIGSSPNSFTFRNTLLWFKERYDPSKMDVFVLLAWADCARMEAPFTIWDTDYFGMNPAADWYSDINSKYLILNAGWEPLHEEERKVREPYLNFMVHNDEYLEIQSMHYVLSMQWYLKNLNIPYLFVNTLHMFSPNNEFLDPYHDLVDETRYINYKDNDLSFYTKYKNLGYENPKATYFHHGEDAHLAYSHELEEHIIQHKLYENFTSGR